MPFTDPFVGIEGGDASPMHEGHIWRSVNKVLVVEILPRPQVYWKSGGELLWERFVNGISKGVGGENRRESNVGCKIYVGHF